MSSEVASATTTPPNKFANWLAKGTDNFLNLASDKESVNLNPIEAIADIIHPIRKGIGKTINTVVGGLFNKTRDLIKQIV